MFYTFVTVTSACPQQQVIYLSGEAVGFLRIRDGGLTVRRMRNRVVPVGKMPDVEEIGDIVYVAELEGRPSVLDGHPSEVDIRLEICRALDMIVK